MVSVVAIDDNLSVLKAVEVILQTAGFEVRIAHDGSEGLEMIKADPPDVVICDIEMPKLNGHQVLRVLRQEQVTADLPVIFLTAYSERTDVRTGMELGADDYITKPFSAKDITGAVEAQIKKRTTLATKYETTLRLLRKNIAYALPHELRTPLAGILGFAGVLEMDYENLKPDELHQIATHIIKSGERLQRVLENYLVYAQLEILGTDPLELEALRNHIVGNTEEIVTAQAQQKAAEVARDGDLVLNVQNIALQISEGDLRKIIEELTDNAFKFSKPGTPVHIVSRRDPKRFTLRIQDHGRGMTAEQIQSVGAYMQFGRMLHEQQGLGLGLVIARRLAELHNAEFQIQSVPDKGTQVSLTFPI
jgi:two-component system sensor histidine kinase/response regulator